MITLTALAAKKIQENLARRGHGLGIRLGVKTTGCSGLSYTIEYVDQAVDQDHIRFENLGVSVWLDQKHLAYLDGTTVDWRRQGLQEGFDFLNPNETARCGCGQSFNV